MHVRSCKCDVAAVRLAFAAFVCVFRYSFVVVVLAIYDGRAVRGLACFFVVSPPTRKGEQSRPLSLS